MITQEQLTAIAEIINQQTVLNEEVLTLLRARFADIHFTYCSDDDVGRAKPVLEQTQFNLYLIDGREHCLCLTNNHDVATGVVVAEIISDE